MSLIFDRINALTSQTFILLYVQKERENRKQKEIKYKREKNLYSQ